MNLPLLLLAVACSGPSTPDRTAPPTPAGMASLSLDADWMIRLDGQEVGALDEPGVLRQSRHRKLMKALLEKQGRTIEALDEDAPGFKDATKTVHVVLDPERTYKDLYPLLVSAAWTGFGVYHLSVLGRPEVLGPLTLDTWIPAPLAPGEPVTGVIPWMEVKLAARGATGSVRFLVRSTGEGPSAARRVPHAQRLLGPRPLVDCATLPGWSEELRAICAEGQKPEGERFPAGRDWPPPMDRDGRGFTVGGPSGCLAAAPGGVAEQPWKDQLQASLQVLGVTGDVRVSLAPDATPDARTVLDTLLAFQELGLPLPAISSQKPVDPNEKDATRKPKEPEDVPCEALIRTREALEGAEARWLGESRGG